MSRLLVILDGASEPLGDAPTTLEAASTPALDQLVADGLLGRLRTTPDGLAPGSETGIPVLLGCPPSAPVGRGWVEAAAARIAVGAGERAWRVDVHREDGSRASAEEATVLAAVLRRRLPRFRVAHLRGHRLLALGPREPHVGALDGFGLRVWGAEAPLAPRLDDATAVVSAPGAAAGCARLLGARVVVPAGATGDVDSDLDAKARAAAALLGEGVPTVVVHVGAPDEAAHRRDPAGKRAALEAADRRVIAPLRRLAESVAVAIDHATSPHTGRHDAAPTPCALAGPAFAPDEHVRLSERAAATTAVRADLWLRERAAA